MITLRAESSESLPKALQVSSSLPMSEGGLFDSVFQTVVDDDTAVSHWKEVRQVLVSDTTSLTVWMLKLCEIILKS